VFSNDKNSLLGELEIPKTELNVKKKATIKGGCMSEKAPMITNCCMYYSLKCRFVEYRKEGCIATPFVA
jgi:hypothetical protein